MPSAVGEWLVKVGETYNCIPRVDHVEPLRSNRTCEEFPAQGYRYVMIIHD